MRQIILIIGITLPIVAWTQVQNKESSQELNLTNLPFNEMSQKVKEKYTKNKVGQFDNFHEQFILMQSLGFPHIHEDHFGENFFPNEKLNEKVINNPQAVFAFEKKRVRRSQALDKSENLAAIQEAYHQRIVSQTELDQIRNGIDEYAKNGYYTYFKSLLAQKPTIDKKPPSVNVCVSLDLKKLGFTSGWGQDQTYQKEIELRHENIKNVIESYFPAGTYSNVILEESCDARLDVTQDGLEYIYTADFVITIIHPDLYLNNPRTFKGF